MINSIPKYPAQKSNIQEDKNTSGYTLTKARYREDFNPNFESLDQYVEKYYYPMKSVELDIKQNENNYNINKYHRPPKKSAYDVHEQEFYNSVKGLVLVDQNQLSGSVMHSMIKRSIEAGNLEDEGLIGDWHPKGRLINTVYPVNCNNDMSHPINCIVASEDSQHLITGSQNGMLHYFDLNYEGDEIKIECMESMLITDVDRPKQINSISVLDSDTTFCVGMDDGILDIYSPYSSQVDNIALIHRISRRDEGSICKTCTFSVDFSRENVFAYATQVGKVHIHDLRVKLDVNSYDIGLKFGMPTAMTTANMNGTHKIIVGTMGGFIHLYDVRYNVPMEIYEHSRNHPIFDICMHYPSLRYKYKMFSEINETQNPHCLISSGGTIASHNQRNLNDTPQMIHEVSFLDIYLGQMKAVYSVDDTMNMGDEPVEVSQFYSHDPIKLSRQPGTSKFKASIYKALSANYVTKILSPLLPNKVESSPYFISAGTDRKLRYWNLAKNKRASYYNISTPLVNESEYRDTQLGDIYTVQEKVTERPADPSKLVTGITYTKKSKAVIASKATSHQINAINEGMYPESNGISSCQTMNMIEYIDIKGTESTGLNQNSTTKLKPKYPVENSAHADAILDMTIAIDDNLGPYIFTAGRDGTVKIFT
jgi:WD40 repeat protein